MEQLEFSESDLKWIKRFKKVMKDAPKELFLFCGSGSLVLYPKRKMKKSACGEDVVDNMCGINIITKMDCDGGDW